MYLDPRREEVGVYGELVVRTFLVEGGDDPGYRCGGWESNPHALADRGF
jgi:hypothetical protein